MMLSIQHLLNPEPERPDTPLSSISQTRNLNPTASNTFPTRQPQQQARLGRRARQMTHNHRPPTQHPVNFAPYEFSVPTPGLTTAQQQELEHWHKHFKLTLCKDQTGSIRDHPRHIEYYTDKIDWFKKTSRRGFHVFEYEFTKPDTTSDHGSKWIVMWDYELGLVRVGQFFKACEGHNKQAPKEAISKSQGLEALCPNVTGGITNPYGVQGYWVPFACARALCTTFCHEIRWALTPVFGYGIVQDCLTPNHPKFRSYKVDASLVEGAKSDEIVYMARLGAVTLPDNPVSEEVIAPSNPQPRADNSPPRRRARIKNTRPKPKPVEPVEERLSISPGIRYSPPVSPKSTPEWTEPTMVAQHVGWTPVNNLFLEPRHQNLTSTQKRLHVRGDNEDEDDPLKRSGTKKRKQHIKAMEKRTSPIAAAHQDTGRQASFIIRSPPESPAKNSHLTVTEVEDPEGRIIHSPSASPVVKDAGAQGQDLAGDQAYTLDEFEAAQILLGLNNVPSTDGSSLEDDMSIMQEVTARK